MENEHASRHHQARIASHIPGRLRIKLGPESRNPSVLEGIKRRLQSHAGIHHVSVDPSSGSVTVQYDPRHQEASGVLGLLEDCDCIFQNLQGMEVSPSSATSAGFLATVDDLNARLSATTGIPLDLKILLPLAFLGAGIWSIGRRGLMLEAVPGWLFLWFALDSFVKLHPAPVHERE